MASNTALKNYVHDLSEDELARAAEQTAQWKTKGISEAVHRISVMTALTFEFRRRKIMVPEWEQFLE